jgi:hypothetical protein
MMGQQLRTVPRIRKYTAVYDENSEKLFHFDSIGNFWYLQDNKMNYLMEEDLLNLVDYLYLLPSITLGNHLMTIHTENTIYLVDRDNP